MTIQELTAGINEMAETLARLSGGDDGLLDAGTTADQLVELLTDVRLLVEVCEEGLGTGLTRAGNHQVQAMVDSWFSRVAVEQEAREMAG